MPSLTLLLQHGVLYGAILSVLMVLAFVGAAYLNPEMWLPDYPPDIRERLGPISERTKRQRRLVGIPTFLLLTGVLVLSSVRLAQIGSDAVFFSVFFGTFVVLLVFNAVDLLILGRLVFVTLRPKIVVLPGTEGAEGYGDYGFHFRAFPKGLAGSSAASLLECLTKPRHAGLKCTLATPRAPPIEAFALAEAGPKQREGCPLGHLRGLLGFQAAHVAQHH